LEERTLKMKNAGQGRGKVNQSVFLGTKKPARQSPAGTLRFIKNVRAI
jgi:hypothetical protein